MKITVTRANDSKRVDFTVDGQAFHTNSEGYGLWEGEDYSHQIEGTAQFSLTQKTMSGIRKALERRYAEESED